MPYLAAKFIVLTLIVALQTALLVALVGPAMLGLTVMAGLKLWGVLWLTAVDAVSLGLLLSAASPSIRVALTLVPLLMLPQILFGGLLRPGPSAVEETPPPVIVRFRKPDARPSGRNGRGHAFAGHSTLGF